MLEGLYQVPRDEIADSIRRLNFDVVILNADVLLRALEKFAEIPKLDFVDCLLYGYKVERGIHTLSGQGDTRPKCRLLAAGGVNVNRRTSSTPHSVALPATKIRYLGSEGVLRLRFVILQGTGTKRTGRTLSDSNAAESQICGAKPCVPLSTEGNYI